MNVLPVRVTKNRYILVDYSIANARTLVLDASKKNGTPLRFASYAEALKGAEAAKKLGFAKLLDKGWLSDDMDVEEFDARLAKYRAVILKAD